MSSVDELAGPGRRSTWLLLFAGFSGVAGWIGANGLLLTHYTNGRHFTTGSATLRTVAWSLLCTSFFLALAGVALPWGLRRLRRMDVRTREVLVAASLFPSALLLPLLMYVGVGVILTAPFGLAYVHTLVLGPDIVQSTASPDGAYEAYVIDRPCLDGPDHHLYVRRGREPAVEVADLPEDVDFNKGIHWSPQSDVVVFQTHFRLIGYRVTDGRTAQVSLGGERHRRANGTFWVDYDAAKRVQEITFPDPGSFSYSLDGTTGAQSVHFGDHG
jgi:YD repeat-containing protein